MTTTRLLNAAQTLLANMCDAGEYGPQDCEENDYPRDRDGSPWYHDTWELNEAINEILQAQDLRKQIRNLTALLIERNEVIKEQQLVILEAA